MVIFNASPLIHCARLGKLEFVLNFFQKITISNAVFQEAIEEGISNGYADAILLKNYFDNGKIEKVTLQVEDAILRGYLHTGEYESILLARSREDFLIIDDRKARLVAFQNHIPFDTTAGVLLILLKEKVIDYRHFMQNLEQYAQEGWLSSEVIAKYVEEGKQYE